jgi:hypothetical protein
MLRMEYFWPLFVSIVLVVVLAVLIASVIKNERKARHIRHATAGVFPTVEIPIKAGRRYNIFLSHGKLLPNAKFVGISPAFDYSHPYLPFPLCQWLVIEKENGRQAYLKPETIRYYEDADE